MINRILIRMKVVQMLYSYLLTRSDFKILPEPESHSRDKRFAYSLYCDLLLLLLDQSGYRISNYEGRPRIEPANKIGKNDWTHIAAALAANDDMKDIALHHRSFSEALLPHHQRLSAAIKESSAFKDYSRMKTKPEIQDEVQLWKTIFTTILLRDNAIKELINSDPGFTHVGYEQALQMLDETLNDFSTVRSSLVEARRGLATSLDKAYELYHALLLLPAEITALRDVRIENARHKFLATPEDLNPNTRMIDNPLPARIAECDDMTEYLKSNPFSWDGDLDMIQRLLDRIMESKIYKDYMEAPATDYKTDCEFWRSVMKNIILPSDDLAEALESKSVYWNDDLEIMGTFVLKTLKRIASSPEGCVELLPKYKDEEDARFGAELFMDAVNNFDEYRSYVEKFINSTSWDPERMAFMDLIVMVTAIAELLNYPLIPIPVTLNEYIEIANAYSTPRSGQFVNGILYSVINYLQEQGKLNKN